jgi:uncharacterized membrane protein YbhN (UPF0104 family)
MRRRIDLKAILAVAIVVVTLAACLIAAPGIGKTLRQALLTLNLWAIAAVCVLQWVNWLVHARALRALAPTASLGNCLLSRWVRDAVTNLLPVAPGMGELAGIRVLSIRGASSGLAVGSATVDVAAETLAQVPYTVLGLALAPAVASRLRLDAIGLDRRWLWLIPLAVVLAIGGVLAWRRWGYLIAAFKRRLLAELRLRGFLGAFALHLAGWLMEAVQLWIGARILGVDLGPAQAVAMSAVVYAGKALFFFIPAGVGVQEVGFVSVGALMNIPPAEALALSLLLRARDAICGAPGLLAWLWLERWRGRSVPTAAGVD